MALVQVLTEQHPGPLPIKGTFTCLSSEAFDVIVTGTSIRKLGSANGPAGVEIIIRDKNGKDVGYTSGVVDGNVAGGRRSCVSQFGQTSLIPGETYSYILQPVFPEVASDAKDFFNAVIIY